MMDLTEKRFGKLIAIKPTKTDKGGFVIWLCKCDCGKEIKVRSGNLNNGNTTTCGYGTIAKEYNVSKATIHNIITRKSWKHI